MLTLFEIQHELTLLWRKLKQHFPQITIPEPKVQLIDLGTVGGRAHFARNTVQLNIHFMQTAEKEMIEETLPHELAHLVTGNIYPDASQAHGPEFRRVLGAISHNTDTKHTMKVEDIKGLSTKIKTKTRFLYKCNCPGKVYKMSTVAHNRMKYGALRKNEFTGKKERTLVGYQCRVCKTPLQFMKDVERSRAKT